MKEPIISTCVMLTNAVGKNMFGFLGVAVKIGALHEPAQTATSVYASTGSKM